VTAQPYFDGTFTSEAVASAAHALVAQLHDEAMATIAALAENWDQPAAEIAAVEDQPVTYRDPATWSVQDDEDEHPAEDDGADDEVRVLPLMELPALLPRPRPAVDVTARVQPVEDAAGALTDEFAVTPEDRQLASR